MKYGAPDAVNMGGQAAFTVGNDKIGGSIGFVRPNAPAAAGTAPPPNAFFTIWRKVDGVWKYIAE